MHKVTIRPTGQVLEVDGETNLLDALKAHGHFVKSSCGGHASCSDCIVKIIDGDDNTNTPPFEEVQLMGNVYHITKERLSCQTYVQGQVTIDISEHDKSAVEKRLQNKSSGFLKNKAPVSTRVRKKEDVDKIMTERQAIRDERRKRDNEWEGHWKKDKDEQGEGAPRIKRLGGGKKPKLFRTDHLENLDEQLQKEREEREAHREKKEFREKREKSFRHKGPNRGSSDKKAGFPKPKKDFRKSRKK